MVLYDAWGGVGTKYDIISRHDIGTIDTDKMNRAYVIFVKIAIQPAIKRR